MEIGEDTGPSDGVGESDSSARQMLMRHDTASIVGKTSTPI
jgi:hypothetical protein